jgi:hypothetical protein
MPEYNFDVLSLYEEYRELPLGIKLLNQLSLT